MHMNTHQLQAVALNHFKRSRQIGIPDPVLAVFTAGIGFLAVTVAKSRVDTQPDAMAGRNLSELLQHIHRTRIHRNAQFMYAGQRRFVNQVSREHNGIAVALRIVSGRQRAFNFPRETESTFTPAHASGAKYGYLSRLSGQNAPRQTDAGGNLFADDLRVVDPHRAAKFGRQAQ
jgi:hypothetical protein